MSACPRCLSPLTTIRYRDGLIFQCPSCHGRAVTFPQMRRVAGDLFITKLLHEINANSNLGGTACPFCQQAMLQFHSQEPRLELDACKQCGVVWFDPHEFESVPERGIESPDEVRLRGIEADAKWRLDRAKANQPTFSGDAPDESWKTIPALFGFPVETESPPLSCQPWLTWSLALAVVATSVAAFSDLHALIERFGFIPAQPWRLGGLTFISPFFLHGGVMHLVGNLYFLLIFGDNVEDYVGRWRYPMLLLAATIVGNVVHWLTAGGSTIPCVGASGGISGVIMFYALQFPRARLGILFRYFFYFRWIQFPAWFALVLWLGLQSVTVMLQVRGFSNVAATAHLGGAAVGLALWISWRTIDRGRE